MVSHVFSDLAMSFKYQVSPKSGTLDFHYFDIWKYSRFWFHLIKHSSDKHDTKIMSSFDSMVISHNIVIVNFLFILVTFQSGIMAFLTSIHCCPEAHWSVQTKQRENLWTAIPAVIARADLTKFVNECVSRNVYRINTTKPYQMILVLFFSQKTMFYLMKSKYAIFSK